MRLSIAVLLLFFIFKSHAGVDASSARCEMTLEPVSLILCMDDEIKDIEQLGERIQNRIFARINIKYSKKEPNRAKVLKAKLANSAQIWNKYRLSYCDMETIQISDEDNRSEFIKQCLLSLSKKRVEDLRLLQLNI